MIRALTVFALAASLLWVSSLDRAEGARPKAAPKRKDSVEELMKKKLTHAQKVLEGLAKNDPDNIVLHAEELIEISKRAQWKVLETPLYVMYSSEFRNAAEDVVKAGKRKNIDGATLAYVEMTMTCVKCHKHVRERRMARAD
jgi:hypothetical protein